MGSSMAGLSIRDGSVGGGLLEEVAMGTVLANALDCLERLMVCLERLMVEMKGSKSLPGETGFRLGPPCGFGLPPQSLQSFG